MALIPSVKTRLGLFVIIPRNNCTNQENETYYLQSHFHVKKYQGINSMKLVSYITVDKLRLDSDLLTSQKLRKNISNTESLQPELQDLLGR